MSEAEQILRERITALGREYVTQLDACVGNIRDIWSDIRFTDKSPEHIQAIYNIAHKLDTEGIKFGFLHISSAARNLVLFLHAVLHNDIRLEEQHHRQIDLLIQLLRSAVLSKQHAYQNKTLNRWKPSRQIPYLRGHKPLILILEEKDFGSGSISRAFNEKGYSVEVYNSFHESNDAIANKPPAVIITDRIFPDRIFTGLENREKFLLLKDRKIPVIFISHSDDIHSHLKAVRAGCEQYFSLPFSNHKLVEATDALISGTPRDPYRVMIVDADRIMTGFYASILRDVGMQVTIEHNPYNTIEMINKDRPELMLVNIHLQECSGLELTTIIRQKERYSGLSIIFLSTEADFDRQLAAINSGGDDLITVPVDPQLLITTINARVERARLLNKLNYDLVSTLRELENQHFALDQHAIVSITNINGTIIYVNDKFCDISGYTRSEVLGRDYTFLRSDQHDKALFQNLWKTILRGEVWQGEICNYKKNGEFFWLNVTIVPFLDEESRLYQFVSISSDITAKIEAEQNMLKARDAAVNANQTKSEFLSRMSHELRTPLNAVMGFSQLLETGHEKSLSDIQQQYVKEIQNAGSHLLNLINEVLDLSRIESDQLTAENITIPLSSFLDECHSLITPMAREKNISLLKNYGNSQNTAVFADPVRLKQVMVNLLSNAIKYNNPSGSVLIQTQLTGANKVIVEVIDTGEGIDDSQKDILFEPFTRLPQHKHEEGVGIGLALSKRLCELMGGKIGVDSKLGSGSRFWFELEQVEYSPVDAITGVRNEQVKSRKNYLELHPYTILYIEDNLANFRLISEILVNRQKIELLHAETALAGIELAGQRQPDIILMDLQLPGLDGFEGLKILRSIKGLAKIPVIAVSAFANEENILRAAEEGFEEYITKPINISGFMSAINSVIERNQLHIRK
jgi:PAS domain S-box-containing protein